MNITEYIKNNLQGFSIRKPAYGQLEYSLRFQLGPDEPSPYDHVTEICNEGYFEEVFNRATTIFEAVFEKEDNVIVIYQEFAWKKHRIRRYNYFFKQFQEFSWGDIRFKKVHQVYGVDHADKWNRAIFEIKAKHINYQNIIRGISNQDFWIRKPSVDGEVLLINTDKNIIYHMYDDRGLDVISSEKKAVQPIYEKYKNWILDYNREEINEIFK